MREKNMKRLAQFFLDKHKVNSIDYSKKYAATLEKTLDKENTPTTIPSRQSILCPKCGALMIKRTASKGQYAGKSFYGCSNYPECRSIINIG